MHGDGSPAINQPGTHDLCAHEPDLTVFAPVRDSCDVSAVLDGAATMPPWLCSLLLLPSGSPLPRAIRLELRRPGGVLFYLNECARPDGQANRFGVIHVRDPVVSGLTAAPALTSLSRAYRGTFSAFASSGCSALLLRPLGCTRLPSSQAAVLSISAI